MSKIAPLTAEEQATLDALQKRQAAAAEAKLAEERAAQLAALTPISDFLSLFDAPKIFEAVDKIVASDVSFELKQKVTNFNNVFGFMHGQLSSEISAVTPRLDLMKDIVK